MKKLFKSNFFKAGLTALIVIVIGVGFQFVINNRGSLNSFAQKSLNVFMPLIYGLVIAYLIWPIVKFLENKCILPSYRKSNKQIQKKDYRRIRIISITVALILVFLLVYSFFGSVVPELYYSIENIINNFPVYYDNVVRWINNILSNQTFLLENNLDELLDSYSKFLAQFTETTILPTARNIVGHLYNGVFNVVNTLLDLIIGIIIAIYLLINKENYLGQCKKVTYSLMDKTKANNLMIDLRFVHETFGGFLVGKIVDSLIIGILCFICTSLLNMPYALLVSVIVGVTNIIPFFGPFIGAIPSAFLILLVSPQKCLIFLIFVLILQQVDGNIIGPTILGNSIGISSFWIIVSITVFGGFFGFLGMLLGVPVFAIIYAFFRRHVNNMLKKKEINTLSSQFINLDYIDDDGRFVMLEDENKKEKTRYMELNPSAQDSNKDNKLWQSVKKLFRHKGKQGNK